MGLENADVAQVVETEEARQAELIRLTTREGVVALMLSSKNPNEWQANCAKVKEANGGGYPSFWTTDIFNPGLIFQALGPKGGAKK